MALTSAGQLLLQRARLILEDVKKLEYDLSGREELPVAELRLGIADSLGTTLVPSLVREVKSTVDRLSVRVDSSSDLCRLLIHRELHAIISSDPLSDRDDLERYEVFSEPLMLALSSSLGAPTQHVKETLTHLTHTTPFLRYAAGSALARQIESLLRRLSLMPPQDMEFNDSETIMEMVRQGLGWAITTPICLLQSRVPPDEITLIGLPYRDTTHTFYLLSRRGELGALSRRLAQMSTQIIDRKAATITSIVRREAAASP
jgi:DNA-binding transcriptional LysR family regulator